MDKHTRENSIKVLKELLSVYQGQLDTRVIAEVEAVIAALESGCDCSEPGTKSKDLVFRVLKVTGEIIGIVTNLSELMDRLQ